jgi:hypothetical protein
MLYRVDSPEVIKLLQEISFKLGGIAYIRGRLRVYVILESSYLAENVYEGLADVESTVESSYLAENVYEGLADVESTVESLYEFVEA